MTTNRAMNASVGLTTLTASPGCSCKLDIETVKMVSMSFGLLSRTSENSKESSIFDHEDAAVFPIDGNRVSVATVDFMTPLLDDAYEWGQATAAHALSDVYAMGATPAFALNILAWPDALLDDPRLQELISGGADLMKSAGVPVQGGHAIRDPIPKYGFCVIGFAERSRLLLKSAARPGDRLILTKPLGLGLATAALRNNHEFESAPAEIYTLLRSINDRASIISVRHGVKCGTDITGFGLIGHLVELLRLSGVSAVLKNHNIPCIRGSRQLAKAGFSPSLAWRNLDQCRHIVNFESRLLEEDKLLLADPQTSGGLLLSVEPAKASQLITELRASGCNIACDIGEVTPLRADELVLIVEA